VNRLPLWVISRRPKYQGPSSAHRLSALRRKARRGTSPAPRSRRDSSQNFYGHWRTRLVQPFTFFFNAASRSSLNQGQTISVPVAGPRAIRAGPIETRASLATVPVRLGVRLPKYAIDVAIGGKADILFAAHMSAFDPKRTLNTTSSALVFVGTMPRP
jgi:hypothetical protein